MVNPIIVNNKMALKKHNEKQKPNNKNASMISEL